MFCRRGSTWPQTYKERDVQHLSSKRIQMTTTVRYHISLTQSIVHLFNWQNLRSVIDSNIVEFMNPQMPLHLHIYETVNCATYYGE